MAEPIVERLLASTEPSVRYAVARHVLGRDPALPEMKRLQEDIRRSPRVMALLGGRDAAGRIPHGAYSKWFGAHWLLPTLADIGYPAGDASLIPLREQAYGWLLSEKHTKLHTRTIQGRVRRCASQEGNALYATLALGIADERADELGRRLATWQWSDGGWNCDKNPDAVNSSFMETLIPLRALALHARVTGNAQSSAAAQRAAEVFLKRRLYKSQKDGSVIRHEFVELHYPCYWHYDILFSLKVMAEAGFIGDTRCSDALDLLESKRLPDGGFPAEARYYQVSEKPETGNSRVGWGGVSRRRMNEFVTADALQVLKAAGRLS